MNERSIIEAPEPNGGSLWVDQYRPAPYAEQPKGSQFDVAWLRGALFRQRWLIGIVLVLALMAGVALTLLTPPTFAASATVRVSPWNASIVEGQDLNTQIVSPSEIDKNRSARRRHRPEPPGQPHRRAVGRGQGQARRADPAGQRRGEPAQ